MAYRLKYSDYSTTAEGPPDPAVWVGPPGPMGPPGPVGPMGPSGIPGDSVVNVLDHGAKGDGTTDDTAAIQAALNAYAGKATVFVPDTGHVYVAAALTIPTGTDLLLHGTLFVKANAGTLLYIQSVSNVTLHGHGTIDCNGTNQTGPQAGVYVHLSNNVLISGISIKNSFNWNLNVVQSSNVRVDSVTMLSCKNSNEFAQGCDACWLTNCLIDGVVDAGFAFYGGVTNSGAIGNVVRNIGIASYSTPLTGVVVLADAGQPNPCKSIVIANNIVHNCTGGGIYCDVASGAPHDGIIVSGNRCHNNGLGVTAGSFTLSDIGVNNSYNVTFIGNQSENFGAANVTAQGLHAASGAIGISFIGNHVKNVGQGTTTGVGLDVNFCNYLWANGNWFYSSPDNPTTNSMAFAITNHAGLHNAYVGNFCDGPVNIVAQSDTVIANLSGNTWLVNRQSFNPLPANAANDAAAAAASVPVGGVYRNGSVLQVRVA